jgi:hypothetical protein
MSIYITWLMLYFSLVLWVIAGFFWLATRAYLAMVQPVPIKSIDPRRHAEVRLGARDPDEK